jgi:hypothetical protein
MTDICGAETTKGEPCQNPKDSCPWHDTDSKPSNGRESKLESHPEIADLIIEEIEHGATISEALAEVEQKTGVHISKSTHRNWMQKGKDETSEEHFLHYRTGITRARELGKRDDRKSIKQRAIENNDIRLQWKIHMKQYGDEYDDEQTETQAPPFALPEDVINEWQQEDIQP